MVTLLPRKRPVPRIDDAGYLPVVQSTVGPSQSRFAYSLRFGLSRRFCLIPRVDLPGVCDFLESLAMDKVNRQQR
jgi:hypothetical protein